MSASKSHSEPAPTTAGSTRQRTLGAACGALVSIAAHAGIGLWIAASSPPFDDLRAPTTSVRSGLVTVRMVRDDRDADPAPAHTAGDRAPPVRESPTLPIHRTTTRLADAPDAAMDRLARTASTAPPTESMPEPVPAEQTPIATEQTREHAPTAPGTKLMIDEPARPLSLGRTPFMYGAPRSATIEPTPPRNTASTAHQKPGETGAFAQERSGKRARTAPPPTPHRSPERAERDKPNETRAEGPNDADASPSAASKKNDPGATSKASPTGEIVPVYPALSRRMGEEGRVVLEVRVLPSGRVGEIRVRNNPGHPRLVESAKHAVRRATFTPAVRNGKPIPSWLVVPVRFVLR